MKPARLLRWRKRLHVTCVGALILPLHFMRRRRVRRSLALLKHSQVLRVRHFDEFRTSAILRLRQPIIIVNICRCCVSYRRWRGEGPPVVTIRLRLRHERCMVLLLLL